MTGSFADRFHQLPAARTSHHALSLCLGFRSATRGPLRTSTGRYAALAQVDEPRAEPSSV